MLFILQTYTSIKQLHVAASAVLLLLSSVTFAQDSFVTETVAEDTPANSVAVSDYADDSVIEARLKRIYQTAAREGWFEKPDVAVANGIVTIRGVADTEEHRLWAGKVARSTEDVVAVINELTLDNSIDLEGTQRVVQKSLDDLWKDFLKRSPLLFAALLVLVIAAVLAKLFAWGAHRVLDKRGIRISLKDLVYQLITIAVWIVGLLIATVIAFPGITPSKALTVLGLGSVAIGFAFKDIFENFFAGFLILWRYPFDRGDYISCNDLMGKVEQITVRNTLIRKLDGELAVVPNATLFKNNVDVLTSQPQRRVRITCGVAYGEDVDQAREVIFQAVQSCETVQGKRTVEVFAEEFASSSINFEVAWWTGSKPIDIRRSRDEVVSAIKRALDKADIEIPFPYRTLIFKDPTLSRNIADLGHDN